MREYGVGDVVSIAAGNRVTVIATIPYAPPPDYKVREIARLDLAREKQSSELYDQYHAEASCKIAMRLVKINIWANLQKRRLRLAKQRAKQRDKIEHLNKTRPLCNKCDTCEGFLPQLFRPMLCEICGHDRASHTRMRVIDAEKYATME